MGGIKATSKLGGGGIKGGMEVVNWLLILTIEMVSGTFIRIYQIVGFKYVPNIYVYYTSIKLCLKQSNLGLGDISHLIE